MTALQPGDLVWATDYRSQYFHLIQLRRNEVGRKSKAVRWAADALCGGHRTYLWDPRLDVPSSEGGCSRCWARWRKLGSPTVVQRVVTGPDLGTLPAGWRAVPVAGCQRDDDPPTGKPKLVEVSRWQRGRRWVRVAQRVGAPEQEGYEVRVGSAWQPDGKKRRKDPLLKCQRAALHYMKLGGDA